MQTHPHAGFLIDLPSWARGATHSGPVWSHESTDLDLTLLTWSSQEGVSAHVNDEVDVLLIGVAGAGEVTVNEEVFRLSSGQILLIPKNTERSLRCTEERWSYLSVHQRRRGLWPTVRNERPL
jgi:quercetin dioxygenase-like cupin family protein